MILSQLDRLYISLNARQTVNINMQIVQGNLQLDLQDQSQ